MRNDHGKETQAVLLAAKDSKRSTGLEITKPMEHDPCPTRQLKTDWFDRARSLLYLRLPQSRCSFFMTSPLLRSHLRLRRLLCRNFLLPMSNKSCFFPPSLTMTRWLLLIAFLLGVVCPAAGDFYSDTPDQDFVRRIFHSCKSHMGDIVHLERL